VVYLAVDLKLFHDMCSCPLHAIIDEELRQKRPLKLASGVRKIRRSRGREFIEESQRYSNTEQGVRRASKYHKCSLTMHGLTVKLHVYVLTILHCSEEPAHGPCVLHAFGTLLQGNTNHHLSDEQQSWPVLPLQRLHSSSFIKLSQLSSCPGH
jgi:hypothetical protein